MQKVFYVKINKDKKCLKYLQIGNNKKCKPECDVDDGIFKKIVKTGTYNIYQCIGTCSNENGLYLIESDKECVNKCPSGKNFIINGEFICRDQCPTTHQ